MVRVTLSKEQREQKKLSPKQELYQDIKTTVDNYKYIQFNKQELIAIATTAIDSLER